MSVATAPPWPSNKELRILIAAGGTAGHINPALTFADALRDRVPAARIEFVGAGKQLEQEVIVPRGYSLHAVPFAAVLGKGPKALLRVTTAFPSAWKKMAILANELKPHVLVGFGGYPSVVPLLYAKAHGIPSILHESNAVVGLANKLLSIVATEIYAAVGVRGFPRWVRVNEIGSPVRDEFFAIPSWAPPSGESRFTIAVVGGSQGAVRVNSAVLAQSDLIQRNNIKVLHQTGAQDFDRVRGEYQTLGIDAEVKAFNHDMVAVYRDAHLVICRAGALTVAEVSAAGRPAIFIPLDAGAAHQRFNIRFLLDHNAAFHLPQTDELPETLSTLLEQLVTAPYTRLAQAAEQCRELSRYGEATATERLTNATLALAHNSLKT